MKASGSGTIKFASVFLLLGGIVNIGLMTAILLNGGYEQIFDDFNIMAAFSAALAYLIGLLQIIGSFIGFKYGSQVDKAKTIIKMGMVLIVATIIWFIPELVTDYQTLNWYVYAYSVLIPILYYVGGKQNRISN